MKNLLFILLCLGICATNQAQLIIGLYPGSSRPKKVTVYKAINTTDTKGNNQLDIDSGETIKIIGARGKNFRVKKITDPTKTTYVLSKEDLIDQMVTKKFVPVVGAFSFPFKYRPQTGLLEANFSLSLTGGVMWNFNNDEGSALSVMGGIGQTSITLTKDNTEPSAGITENTTRSGTSLSLSCLYHWGQLQLAGSIGIDINNDNHTDKWKYQSKPWLTLGIGFNIFTGTGSDD